MAYIIEDAVIVKHAAAEKTSILVRNNKMDYIHSSVKNMAYMKMDASPYVMTPGHVMLDFSINGSYSEAKPIFKDKLIASGCTAVITVARAEYERELSDAVRKKRQRMINSPIDYCISAAIPLKRLTPSLLIACKRQKIPLLVLEIHPEDDLAGFPWEWIRSSIYHFPMTFLPQWPDRALQDKQQKTFEALMKKHRFSASAACPPEHTILDKNLLMKIGLFPDKGDIRIGGEVDYNLYEGNAFNSVEDLSSSGYHSHIPKFTVHKGQLQKAGETIFLKPGFGEERTVAMSGRFAAQAVP